MTGDQPPPTGEKAVLAALPKPKAGDVASQPATGASNAKPSGVSGTYAVQEGDTLSRIAKRHGVSTVALKAANGLDDGMIRIGQTLKIPAGGKADVAAAAPAASAPAVSGAGEAIKPREVAAYTPPKKAEKKPEAKTEAKAKAEAKPAKKQAKQAAKKPAAKKAEAKKPARAAAKPKTKK